jgi:hypothetical protein
MYSNKNIQEISEKIQEIVNSDEYREVAISVPVTVERFALYSYIMEKIRNFKEAFLGAQYAYWQCDDDAFIECSVRYRLRALKMYVPTQPFPYDESTRFIVLADIARVCGDFKGALMHIGYHLAPDDSIFKEEKRLIRKKCTKV